MLSGQQPPSLPANIALGDRSVRVLHWLRVLPGKRLVGHARLDDREVLVKLFLGKVASRKAARELAGITLLQQAGLPTPVLVGHGESEDSQLAWVITRYYANAKSLAQLAGISIEAPLDHESIPVCLTGATCLLAQLHNCHLIQSDVHPDNLLFDGDCGTWLLIDAAEIRAVNKSSAASQVQKNLALYLAQFPDHWRQTIISAYLAETSYQLDQAKLDLCANRYKLWRSEKFAEKSLRNATLFRVTREFLRYFSSWREDFDHFNFMPDELDAMIARAHMLKDGGSATLVKLSVDGRDVVLKRYNLKNLRHGMRRLFRCSRAWHSWQTGHKLRLLGIRTPRPLALQEERLGVFRRRAYLFTEYCEGMDLQSFTDQRSLEQLKPMLREIENLLTLMRRYRVVHGDFKATNFIWNGKLQLIDLDAVRFYRSESRWRKAYNKDLERLLRNWPVGSPTHGAFLELITKFR